MIPIIDISSLYGKSCINRDKVNQSLIDAATSIGFAQIKGIPNILLSIEVREKLLSIFLLSNKEKRKLFRWNFEKKNKNIYR